MSKDDAEVLKDLDGALKRVVFGQDEAVRTQIIELKKFLAITQHALDPLLKG